MLKRKVVVNRAVLVVLVVVLAAIGSVVLLAGMAANAEGVLLRYKFVPQQELAYDFWMVGTGDATVTGVPRPPGQGEKPGPLHMQFEVNAEFSLPVTAVDEQGNGTLGLEMGPLSMQGTMELDGESMPMPLGPMQQALPSFENLSWTISPRGELVAISGLAELLPDGGAMPAMLPNTADLQQLLNEMPAWFPEDPVVVGQSWDMQVPVFVPGMAAHPLPEFAMKYTFEGLERIDGHRIARIGFEGALEDANLAVPMPAGPAQQQGEPAEDINMALTEIVGGHIYFDLDAGQMHNAAGRIEIDASISMPLPTEAGEEAGKPLVTQIAINLDFTVSPAL